MSSERDVVTEAGIGMGVALAMILSYETNHSSFWAILHGFCSWIYCIYHWITY
jgi:hypothetical protein